jgi:hypothetical protein
MVAGGKYLGLPFLAIDFDLFASGKSWIVNLNCETIV